MDTYLDAEEKHILLEVRIIEDERSWRYVIRLLNTQKDGRAILHYLKQQRYEATPSILYLNGEKIGFRYYYTDVEHDGGPTRLHSKCIFDPKVKKYNDLLLDDVSKYGISINNLEYRDYWDYKY